MKDEDALEATEKGKIISLNQMGSTGEVAMGAEVKERTRVLGFPGSSYGGNDICRHQVNLWAPLLRTGDPHLYIGFIPGTFREINPNTRIQSPS